MIKFVTELIQCFTCHFPPGHNVYGVAALICFILGFLFMGILAGSAGSYLGRGFALFLNNIGG